MGFNPFEELPCGTKTDRRLKVVRLYGGRQEAASRPSIRTFTWCDIEFGATWLSSCPTSANLQPKKARSLKVPSRKQNSLPRTKHSTQKPPPTVRDFCGKGPLDDWGHRALMLAANCMGVSGESWGVDGTLSPIMRASGYCQAQTPNYRPWRLVFRLSDRSCAETSCARSKATVLV